MLTAVSDSRRATAEGLGSPDGLPLPQLRQPRPPAGPGRGGLAARGKNGPTRTVERILHAGLAYKDVADRDTSLVVCNATAPNTVRAITPLRWGFQA